MKSPADGFRRILEVFDRLEIPYAVVGSVASSRHGIPRTTFDADFVADLRANQVDEFAGLLQADFYADPGMMKDALAHGRSFNLIHFDSSYKYDVFPVPQSDFGRIQFGRRRYESTEAFGEPVECAIATPEDTILSKLRWYRAGGETSEQQWNDLRGIKLVQREKLDLEYMREWAPRIGVADVLERLLSES